MTDELRIAIARRLAQVTTQAGRLLELILEGDGALDLGLLERVQLADHELYEVLLAVDPVAYER